MPAKYRRGYPVAVLLSLGADRGVVWMIFSHVAKLEKIVTLNGDRRDSRAVYGFHEALVNVLRLRVKEGVKSVVVASPIKSDYAQAFVRHVRDHHIWLVQGQNKLVLSEVDGSAGSLAEASELVKRSDFTRLISEAASEEGENLIEVLERSLSASDSKTAVLYSFEEIEGRILRRSTVGKAKPDYLLLTNKYLTQSGHKGRLNRLIQIAQNRGVKTKIVDAKSNAGLRLAQFGGIICILKVES